MSADKSLLIQGTNYRVRSGAVMALGVETHKSFWILPSNGDVLTFVKWENVPNDKHVRKYIFRHHERTMDIYMVLSIQRIWIESDAKVQEWYDNMPMLMFEKVI